MLEYHTKIKIKFAMKNGYIFLVYFVLLLSFSGCNNTTTSSAPSGGINNEDRTINQRGTTLEIPKEKVAVTNKHEQQVIDTIKCNIQIIRQTEEKLNMLKSSEINLFLRTLSKDCSHNIEFTEYSNRILYKVLELYPSELIECISSSKEIDPDYIFSELANPLLDINGKKLKEIINKAHGETGIKDKLIRAIEKAME